MRRFLPLSPYGIAKKCGEEYLAGWNRIHGTSHVSLRFANVYGPRQDSGLEGGVVSIFLERLVRNEPTMIFGDGRHSRDFVYVDDVVAALLAAVGRGGGPYNVGSGEETTVAELHAAAARAVGSDAAPTFAAARLGDVLRSALDSSRIERELGWQPGPARRRPRANARLDAAGSPGVVAKRGARGRAVSCTRRTDPSLADGDARREPRRRGRARAAPRRRDAAAREAALARDAPPRRGDGVRAEEEAHDRRAHREAAGRHDARG